MTTSTDHNEQSSSLQTDEQRTTTKSAMLRPGPSLGLLDDASAGYPATDSKDVEILRRLKLAILEGQHPYFKANVNLLNLQDLVLPAPAPHLVNPAWLSETGLSGQKTISIQANHTLSSTVPQTSTVAGINGRTDIYVGETTMDKRSGDIEMNNVEPKPTPVISKDSGMIRPEDCPGNTAATGKAAPSGSLYTLGRHTLLSPIESEFSNHIGRRRSTSDASTVIDTTQPSLDPITEIKRESPPHQLSGSHTLGKDPTSSSLSSFASTTTTSTVLTSENEADADTPVKPEDGDIDLSGYDPKYGNKADYLRHQKARVKMIESVEDKGRKPGSRPDEKPQAKSPPRQSQGPPRRGTGTQGLPVREPEYVPRTSTLPPPSRTSSVHVRETSPSGPRRGSTTDTPKDRPPPPSVRQSPRRSQATSFSRPASPPGRYPPLSRPRDYSPSREIRPQYLPYGDPVSVPARPRPVVSSPPRGSPPRETLASRVTDRQVVDDYPGSLRRSEARSFDLRPASASSVFADRPGSRDNGAFNLDHNDTWAASARGLPHGLPSRDSPPPRERTSFTSASLPVNPAAGYRPQAVPDQASATRYAVPYDPAVRHLDMPWPSRDWDANQPPESKPKLQDRFGIEPTWSHDQDRGISQPPEAKPKLQDRFAIDPAWSRDRDRERDDFGPRSRERDGYRREPSPVFSDGLRSGFRRPSDIESGMRPMKRSRPDEGFVARGASGADRARYELDGRPASDYYSRDPVRRLDDDYIPRTRPSYDSWAGGPP